MSSLKRRRDSPSSSTEQSPVPPFATNSSTSAPIPATYNRHSSAPVSGQISTDPSISPYGWRDYSPIYHYPPHKRPRVMVPSSPYTSSSGQDFAPYSSASYDPSGISSLPTPAPTLIGPTSYGSVYSTSPMPPSSGMSAYPTPSTTYSQTPSSYQTSTSYAQTPVAYQTQQSPVSSYGQSGYYSTTALAFGMDPVISEQQLAKARRQQQNREAQKRFREKKKKTQAEMETRLDELEKQLEESQEDNTRLEVENEQLRRTLAAYTQRGQSMGHGGARPPGRPGQPGSASDPRRPTLSP